MANKKNKLENITLPAGTARYPWLNTPDTQFNPDGHYKVGIIYSADDENIKKLMEDLKAKAEVYLKEKKDELEAKGGKNKALAKSLEVTVPFEPLYDEEGNETGEVVFNTKMKAQFKDQKTGNVKTIIPKIFNSQKEQLKNPPNIFGGSILKVNAGILPVFVPSAKVAGVSLRLNAVQIIELSTGGADADAYGFDEEPEGYIGSDVDETGDDGPSSDISDDDTTDF